MKRSARGCRSALKGATARQTTKSPAHHARPNEDEARIRAYSSCAAKVAEFYAHFCRGDHADEAFICGPDSMITTVTAALAELGMRADTIHAERFGVPRRGVQPAAGKSAASKDTTTVTVIMDGHTKSFDMARNGVSIVDAAADSGVELPYSCKGGVCATCRTHLREGDVRMETNYGLEPWEVEAGFVLACQSQPVSEAILLDYDKA